MSNVMLLFNFVKGFGPAHEDDDIYYIYYKDDDKVTPYVVGWEVGVTFFYNFGTYQTTFWGFIIMAITCYMITKQALLDLKQLYPFLVGFGTILPLLIAFLRIFLYSPLGSTNYFYEDSGPSPLYYFATMLRNVCVIGMFIFCLMFYYWEKERKGVNPQMLKLINSVSLYPVIELVVRIVYYMQIINETCYHNKDSRATFAIDMLVNVTYALQGSMYFVVFIARDDDAYNYVKRYFMLRKSRSEFNSTLELPEVTPSGHANDRGNDSVYAQDYDNNFDDPRFSETINPVAP